MALSLKHTFIWTCDNSWTNIKIFRDKKLFGHIVGLYDGKKSTINGKHFCGEKKGGLAKFLFITDPSDDKAYCEFTPEGIKAPAFEYKYQRANSAFSQVCFLDERGEIVLELDFNKVNLTKAFLDFPSIPLSGTIRLYVEKDIELLLYAIFLFYDWLRDADVNVG